MSEKFKMFALSSKKISNWIDVSSKIANIFISFSVLFEPTPDGVNKQKKYRKAFFMMLETQFQIKDESCWGQIDPKINPRDENEASEKGSDSPKWKIERIFGNCQGVMIFYGNLLHL
jgi:hypothetical protein